MKEEIALVLANRLRDPALKSALIMDVELTRDLRLARVYYCLQGGPEGREAAQTGFDRARGFIKKEIAPLLGLRYMPDLEFLYDDSIDQGQHMEALLKKLRQEGQGE
jgi:ribosome-binding factor A